MRANLWMLLPGLLACGHAAPPVDTAGALPAPSASPSDAAAPSVMDAVPEASTAIPADGGAPSVASTDASPAAAPVFEAQGPSYPAEALRELFVRNEAKLRACFEPGRKRDPKLRGHVNVKFTIGRDGKATSVEDQGSNLEDPQVIACVVKLMKTLRFAKPEEGSVTVVYPFIFHSTEPILILPDTAPRK